MRTITYGIKKENKRREEARMVEGGAGNDRMEVEMAGGGEHYYRDGPAGNTDVGEDTVVAAEGVLQQDQENEITDEEIRAATIELEDLLDLMEVHFQFPHSSDFFLSKLITVYNSPKHLPACRI